MLRALLPTLGCLLLAGCITNTQGTQNLQADTAGGAPVARPLPARPRMTTTALLASARLITVHKTTVAGATLRLSDLQALSRDCTPEGDVVVQVTSPPDHGTIHVVQGTVFSNYKPGDPPYFCNAMKTPATIISYRATAGFSGSDVAVIHVFFPDGHAPMVRYDIDVE